MSGWRTVLAAECRLRAHLATTGRLILLGAG
jgi:hypothetical protein